MADVTPEEKLNTVFCVLPIPSYLKCSYSVSFQHLLSYILRVYNNIRSEDSCLLRCQRCAADYGLHSVTSYETRPFSVSAVETPVSQYLAS
jgi:hypothetical protein